jgi:dihydrofolate reductase
MKYTLICIVAHSHNDRIIGNGPHDLPNWRLKKDFAHFVQKTKEAGVVIMGRNTWQSIPAKFKPLKDRTTIVISQTLDAPNEHCLIARSLEDAIELAKPFSHNNTICVAGGEQIYKLALPKATALWVTRVYGDILGDKVFPEYTQDTWIERESYLYPKDQDHSHAFSIIRYERRV